MNVPFSLKSPPNEPEFTEKFGLDTGPVPVSGMSDPDYFEREVELIWKKFWLYAGKTFHIPKPGDFIVKDFEFANTSIIITRGRDGQIRAFHNVCSHRCNKVEWDECGNRNVLRCKFHGWVYGLDGDLIGVTDQGMFNNLNKSELGLTPVACEVWEGFIFINLDPEPQMSLRDYLGDFHDGLHGYPFETMTREYKWRIRLNCNWKLLRDAFIEAYHIAYIHAETAAKSFTGSSQPDLRALAVKMTEYGGQYSMAANLEFQPPPNQALAFKMGGAAVQNVGVRQELPDCLNPARAMNWAGDLNMFFPGFGCPTFPGTYVMNSFIPIDAKSSIYELHSCYDEPRTATERWTQEVGASLFFAGVLEDLKTLEMTQSVIEGGGKTEMVLQDQEIFVRQNHTLVQKICGPYPGAGKQSRGAQ